MAKRKPKPVQNTGAKHPGSENLCPPWKPGVSGNPKGRPAAGLAVCEWWNQMQDWPVAQLQEAIDDPASSVAKVAAARAWLHATSTQLNAGGSPIAGADLDRIIENTSGRATQRVEIKHEGEFRTTADGAAAADQLLAQLRELYGTPPAPRPG